MKKTGKLLILSILGGICVFFCSGTALAQVTGELVEPDVMLVIDSSASMDWADNVPTDWNKSRTEWSIESCRRINEGLEDYGKTSWQKLITAFLGGVNTDILKCVNEPPIVRPSLHAYAEDEEFLQGVLDDRDFNGVPDYISEFRKVSWSHFRLVSCESQYWVQNRAGYYQCFDKSDPTQYNSSGYGNNFYCMYDDEMAVDGITNCKNLNPMAGPRFSNGIISRYENLARFGIMTYDNVPSCLSESCDAHDKLWDYGYCRNWMCQGNPEEGGDIESHTCPAWNAGTRGPGCNGDSCTEEELQYNYAIGGMVKIQHNIPPADQNERVRKTLETMEPLFCSPIAALVDDAGYYYATDQSVLPAGVDPNSAYHGTDKYFRCRRKVAIMISDGQPTQAFEFAAGSCGNTATYDDGNGNLTEQPYKWLPEPQSIEQDPEDYDCDQDAVNEPIVDCPWLSTPEEASEIFQVGENLLDQMALQTPEGETDDDLPIYMVVIGYNVPEIDCSLYPDKCIPYTQYYYENKRCWEDMPPCPPDATGADAGVACSYDCLPQVDCTAAGGSEHTDMSCSGSDVCCELPEYTCADPYTCLSTTECTAQGGSIINGETCPGGNVCCSVPVYTCTEDCLPTGICASIGGSEITTETCPSGETCCDTPDLSYGFSVNEYVSLGTNNYVDSYDSETGVYGGANQFATATVSTNSTANGAITLDNATIGGDAYVGVGGNVSTVIVETGTGSVTGEKLVLPENVPMPAVQPPTGMPANEGSVTNSGGSVTWSSDRHFNDVTFTGVSVTVSGIVRVHIEGNFEMNAGNIVIGEDSALLLYIGGNFTVGSNALLNAGASEPERFVTVMLGSGEWSVSGGAEIHTIGLQPDGGLTLNAADYYGVYIGDHITGTANTNCGFHMDLSAVDDDSDDGSDAGTGTDTDVDVDTDTDTDTDSDEGTDVVCRMSPREFLNEVACQGWPYQPKVVYNGLQTDKKPPWINPSDQVDDEGNTVQFCEPEGYTGDPNVYICRDNERAMFVNDPMKLQQAIDLILGSLSPPTWATRTDLVTWNVELSEFYEETATQYEFRTGYVVPYGQAWKGVLTRYDWSCRYQNEAPESELRDVPALLEGQNDELENARNIYSLKIKDDGILSDSDYLIADPTITNITSWIDQAGTTNYYEVKELVSSGPESPGVNDFNDCDFFGPNDTIDTTDCENKGELRDHACTYTLERGLADIYNSTPDILAPPRGNADIRSYSVFRDTQANKERHPYLFVGTNDGVLHAFDVEEMGNETSISVEKFGYIPRSILGQIKDQYPITIIEESGGYSVLDETDSDYPDLFQHKWLLDGSPITRDMLLARSVTNPEGENADHWRSIVMGGLGKGGRGYYALDVTDAVAAGSTTTEPNLLWEISRDARLYGNNAINSTAQDAIDKMEFPLSKPALAYVPEEIGSTTFSVAAAVLPGGYNSDPTITTGVYIVRLGDGKILKYFEPGAPGDTSKGMCADVNTEDDIYVAGLDSDSEGLRESAQLVGEPLVLQGSRYGSLASEVLISDDRGRIWIIENLDDEDSTNWCMKLYFDSLVAWHFPYQNCIDGSCTENVNCFHEDCCNQTDPPSDCAAQTATRNMNSPRVMILGGISMALDDNNNPVLVFGTGQYDGLSLWNRNRIFSITDILERDAENNKFHVPKINWWVGDLGLVKSDVDFPSTSFSDLVNTGENVIWLSDIQTEMSKTYLNPSMDSDLCPSAQAIEGNKPVYFFNVGEKLIGRPTIFNEFAYFTTFVPIEDPASFQDACEAGTSRIWGIKYNAKLCKTAGDCEQNEDYTLDSEYLSSAFDSIIGGFTCGTEETESSKWKLFTDYPGDLLSAVQVVRRPDCVGRGDVFELTAQKKNPEAGVTSQGTPPPDTVTTVTAKLDRGGGIDIVMLRFDSWSLVFE